MSFSKVLDVDPATGVTRWFHADEDGKGFTIQTQQRMDEIREANLAAYKEAPTKWGDGQRVASIPLTIWARLKRDGVLDDQKAFRKWLNDPDNRVFRTRPGTV
jgi:hypothetical protein